MPEKINFKMYQGSTFNEVIHWESAIKGYKAISSITKAAPVVITSAAHGITNGWRFKVANVLGMTELNSKDGEWYIASDKTSDTVSINSINSLGYKDYTSGGVLEYNIPVNLTGYSARMQLRAKIDSATIIDEYTNLNGKIVIDATNNSITILVSALDTSQYNFSSCIYSLEMESGTGVVTQIATGTIALIKEVTR